MILFYMVFASHTANAKSTSIWSITAFFYIFVIHSLLSYAIILFCALLGAVSLNYTQRNKLMNKVNFFL